MQTVNYNNQITHSNHASPVQNEKYIQNNNKPHHGKNLKLSHHHQNLMEVSALNLFSRPDKLKAMIPKKKRKNASEDHTNTSTLRTHKILCIHFINIKEIRQNLIEKQTLDMDIKCFNKPDQSIFLLFDAHNLRGVSNASINSNQNRSNMNLNSYALGNNPYQQNSSSLTLNYLKDQQNTAIQMHKRKTLSDSLTRLNLAEGMTQYTLN